MSQQAEVKICKSQAGVRAGASFVAFLDPQQLTAGKSLLPCAVGLSWSCFSSWSTWQSWAARSWQQFTAAPIVAVLPWTSTWCYWQHFSQELNSAVVATPRGFIELLWKSLLVVFIYTCNKRSQALYIYEYVYSDVKWYGSFVVLLLLDFFFL